MIYHVKARRVFWCWTAPLCAVAIGRAVMEITKGQMTGIGGAAIFLDAVFFFLCGGYLYFQRHRIYPPVRLSDAGLSLTNHAVEFMIDWQDIDRERSVLHGQKWRFYRKSKPHFHPISLKLAWYDEGLKAELVARLGL